MSGWTFIIVGGVMVAIGGILATHGWNQVKKQEDLISLSVSPSVEIDINNDKIVFKNTGPQDIIDLRVNYSVYKFERGTQKILLREALGQCIQLSNEVQVGKTVEISPKEIPFIEAYEATDEKLNANIVWASIFEFRRKIDGKRYVQIEPFFSVLIDNNQTLFSLYSNGKVFGGGNPNFFLNIFEEIDKIETRFYKAANK